MKQYSLPIDRLKHPLAKVITTELPVMLRNVFFRGDTLNYYMLSIIGAILLAIIIIFPLSKILLKLIQKRNKNNFISKMSSHTLSLIGMLTSLEFLFFSMHFIEIYFKKPFGGWFVTCHKFLFLSLGTYIIWKMLDEYEDYKIEGGSDPTFHQMASNLLKMFLSFLYFLAILALFKISISGLLAFGGVGGIVIGVAAKDLLSNIFGSVIIFLDKPFRVGDWICSPDRSLEGTVEKIGLRVTRIRTFSQRPLYVPNSVFSNIIVENPTRMNHRRIHEVISLRHCDQKKIASITEEIESMLLNHRDISSRVPFSAHFSKVTINGLDLLIDAYTKTKSKIEYQKTKQHIYEGVLEILEKHGAKCASPRRVNVQEGKE